MPKAIASISDIYRRIVKWLILRLPSFTLLCCTTYRIARLLMLRQQSSSVSSAKHFTYFLKHILIFSINIFLLFCLFSFANLYTSDFFLPPSQTRRSMFSERSARPTINRFFVSFGDDNCKRFFSLHNYRVNLLSVSGG